MTTGELRAAWLKRLDLQLARFKKVRGYDVDPQIIAASKRGIEQAVARGIAPVTEN